MKKCDEEKLLAHLGVVLYENLGEEYPGGRGGSVRGVGLPSSRVGLDGRVGAAFFKSWVRGGWWAGA